METDKKSHQMYEYLIGLINKNKYLENFKLPSENRLAKGFNSSRMCAQLAYQKLEKEKFVTKKKGSGHFINTEYVLSNNSNTFIEAKIAVLGPTITSRFLGLIYETINNTFSEKGLIPSFFFSSMHVSENKLLEMFVKKHYDAIILYTQYEEKPSKLLIELVDKNFPVVLIDRYYKGLNAYTVSSNHFASSYKIIEYFYNKGRKKILFISEPPIYTSILHRFNGYKTALNHFPILKPKSKELLYEESNLEEFQTKLSNYI